MTGGVREVRSEKLDGVRAGQGVFGRGRNPVGVGDFLWIDPG